MAEAEELAHIGQGHRISEIPRTFSGNVRDSSL